MISQQTLFITLNMTEDQGAITSSPPIIILEENYNDTKRVTILFIKWSKPRGNRN